MTRYTIRGDTLAAHAAAPAGAGERRAPTGAGARSRPVVDAATGGNLEGAAWMKRLGLVVVSQKPARPVRAGRSAPSGGGMSEGGELDAALADLARASRHRLAEHWRAYFGAAPPPRTSRSLLLRAVAYKMQERALGGLSTRARRRLNGPEPRPVRRHRGLKPGTVLVREWHGVAYQVRVLEGGVLYHGERYRSLSEVARRITGTRWSGPRFFGLKA
jgi:hypothetical protein